MENCEICASDAIVNVGQYVVKNDGTTVEVIDTFKCDYCFSVVEVTSIKTVTKKLKSDFYDFLTNHYRLLDEFGVMVDNFVTSNAFMSEKERTQVYRLKNIMVGRMEMDHDDLQKEFHRLEGK